MKTTFALLCALAVRPLNAQEGNRPKVLGVAHMALYVKDLDKTRQFYEKFRSGSRSRCRTRTRAASASRL
jgi:hypothetical protein